MTHQPLPPFSCWAGPRENVRMLLLGEAWGREESESGPFVGEAGKELWRMLGEAIPDHEPLHRTALYQHRYGTSWVLSRKPWLEACSISMTNVLNFRPPDNKIEAIVVGKRDLPSDYPKDLPAIAKGKYLLPEFLPELDRLVEEISQSHPTLIVAFGNTACWALLHSTSIGALRGAITQSLTGVKMLPSYHPAAILRQWSWRPIVVADLMKAWHESEFPEIRRPERQILVNPTIEELGQWMFVNGRKLWMEPYATWSVDIETKSGQITCIGFACAKDEAVVIPFLDESKPGWSYWSNRCDESKAWGYVRDALVSPAPKLFQNGVYDLQYLYHMGLRPVNVVHDTMLLHHALHPEFQKGLGFLGSIYTSEPAWKLMRRKHPDTEKRDE